jgi:dolichol-phosphate mannosyltransferase
MSHSDVNSIAVVIPVYKGTQTIVELVQRLHKTLLTCGIPYRIILVDDRSPDDSWMKIKELVSENVKGIRLSRNFGQHPAITAGLREVKESHVIIMDCDLQDAPEEIPRLLAAQKQGYSIVYAKRKNRKDSFLARNGSRFFYGILSYLSGSRFDEEIANFGIYEKRCVDAVLKMGDHFRFFPVMIQWVGFNSTTVDVEHNARTHGISTYTIFRKLILAINVMLFFSEKPLKIQAVCGMFLAFSSFAAGLVYFLLAYQGYIKVSGFPTLIISVFFLSGLIILFLGVLGLYIGNIFNQVKKRPIFFVDEEK